MRRQEKASMFSDLKRAMVAWSEHMQESQQLIKNLATLKAGNARVVNSNAMSFLAHPKSAILINVFIYIPYVKNIIFNHQLN